MAKDIGSVQARFEADTTSFDASVKGTEQQLKAAAAAARLAGDQIAQAGDKIDRTATLQAQARTRAERAWQREIVAQERAAQKEAEISRARELAALRADIETRSVERATRAQEFYGQALRRGRELMGVLLPLGAGLGAVAAVESLKQMVEKTAEAGQQLNKLHQQTGLSVQDLSLLKYAANQADVEFDSLVRGFKRLATSTYDAQSGVKSAQKGFGEAGITMQDLRAKGGDMYSVLSLLAAKFSQMPEGIQKTDAANKIFGQRMGSEMIPVLNQLGTQMDDLKSRAERMGIIWSDTQIEQMERMDQKVKDLKASFDGLGLSLTAAVAPALTTLAQQLPQVLGIGGLGKHGNDFAAGLQAIADKAHEAVLWVAKLGYIQAGDFAAANRLDVEDAARRRAQWEANQPKPEAKAAPGKQPPAPIDPEVLAAQARKRMERAREELIAMQATHTMSLDEQADYWQKLANTSRKGSDLYNAAMKEANQARASALKESQAAMFAGLMDDARTQKKFKEQTRDAVGDEWLRLQQEQEQSTQQAQAQAVQSFQATVQAIKAMEQQEEDRIRLQMQIGRLSPQQGAMRLQSLHQDTYAQWLANARDLSAQFPYEQKLIPGAGETIRGYEIQAQRDQADVEATKAMGELRRSTALLVEEFTNAGRQISNVFTRGLEDFNQTLMRVLTTPRSWTAGQHPWRQLGGSLVQTAGNAALQYSEGRLIQAIPGIGNFFKNKQLGGSKSNRLFTSTVIEGSTGGTTAVSSLVNTGSSLANGAIQTAWALAGLPGFADGGPMSSGMPAIVGERGPELFVPSISGRIVPNDRAGFGGSMVFAPNIDARGATDPAGVRMQVNRAMQEWMPSILSASRGSINDYNRRVPSKGKM